MGFVGGFGGGLLVPANTYLLCGRGFVLVWCCFLILLVLITWWFVNLVLNFVLDVGAVGNFNGGCRVLWIWCRRFTLRLVLWLLF